MTSRLRRWLARALATALLAASPALSFANELPTAAPADAGLASERLGRLGAFVERAIAEGRIPGAVVLIARHGRVVHHEAYGVADRDTRRPMRRDDVFRIYSMTKPVVSVALLTLYEKGKFQLDDPLELYIPAFKGLKVFAGTDAQSNMTLEEARRKPTIHDAFRHTLGLSAGAGAPFSPASKMRLHSSGTLAGLSRKSSLSWATYAAFKPVDSVAAIADVL